jgi:hypothetical protein
MPQTVGESSLTYLCELSVVGKVEVTTNDLAINRIAPKPNGDNKKDNEIEAANRADCQKGPVAKIRHLESRSIQRPPRLRFVRNLRRADLFDSDSFFENRMESECERLGDIASFAKCKNSTAMNATALRHEFDRERPLENAGHLKSGGRLRIRTADPLGVNEML